MPNSTLPPMRHANAAQHMMASWARSRSDCVMGVLSPIGWSITSFMNVTVAYSRCRCDEPWKKCGYVDECMDIHSYPHRRRACAISHDVGDTAILGGLRQRALVR